MSNYKIRDYFHIWLDQPHEGDTGGARILVL